MSMEHAFQHNTLTTNEILPGTLREKTTASKDLVLSFVRNYTKRHHNKIFTCNLQMNNFSHPPRWSTKKEEKNIEQHTGECTEVFWWPFKETILLQVYITEGETRMKIQLFHAQKEICKTSQSFCDTMCHDAIVGTKTDADKKKKKKQQRHPRWRRAAPKVSFHHAEPIWKFEPQGQGSPLWPGKHWEGNKYRAKHARPQWCQKVDTTKQTNIAVHPKENSNRKFPTIGQSHVVIFCSKVVAHNVLSLKPGHEPRITVLSSEDPVLCDKIQT